MRHSLITLLRLSLLSLGTTLFKLAGVNGAAIVFFTEVTTGAQMTNVNSFANELAIHNFTGVKKLLDLN